MIAAYYDINLDDPLYVPDGCVIFLAYRVSLFTSGVFMKTTSI